MLAHLGFFLLLIGSVFSGFATFAAIFAGLMRHRRLLRSARLAATFAGTMVLFASILLWYFLFQRDFSVSYVFKNSSLDLPKLFTFTAFWSSLEGSHLLWTLLMSGVMVIASWVYAKDNEHIIPWVMAVLSSVVSWMCFLAITHSDPFGLILPAAPNGNGMNTLLQNPYMAIHPPLLFIGYVCLAVPFAYAIAALAYGDITEGWLRTVRRWSLIAFCSLTAALALGGRWAYVELGWAGYWAWDPVENSSFMPWILSTALLHSLLVQEKLGHLKRLSIGIAIAAFFMTFLGTFITRSGIISSVHAFAESPIGPNYLVFLAALLGISLGMYGWRGHSILPPDVDKAWGVSKESALVVTQFLLLSFAAIVFIGTIFPVVTEAVSGQKVSIQAPYFNSFAPWFGLAVMLAVGCGNLMHYQTSKVPAGPRIMITAAIVAIIPAVALIHFGDVMRTPEKFAAGAQILGMYISCWTMSCLLLDLNEKMKPFARNRAAFFRYNLSYFGAVVAHIGSVICIIGFLGNYRGMELQESFAIGETKSLYGYDFKFASQVVVEQHDNADAFVAPVEVSKDGRVVAMMRPAQRRYPTSNEPTNEIAVESSIWFDIYIVLAGLEQKSGDRVTLKININPTVRFVWYGIIVMVIGGFIAICDRRKGRKSKDALIGAWSTDGVSHV
jgi:cytochrome c-type biogenesis protein CcmF